eukprot:COSAG06_NODE_5330_length_3548_cov_1.843433_2_plen_889_part_00
MFMDPVMMEEETEQMVPRADEALVPNLPGAVEVENHAQDADPEQQPEPPTRKIIVKNDAVEEVEPLTDAPKLTADQEDEHQDDGPDPEQPGQPTQKIIANTDSSVGEVKPLTDAPNLTADQNGKKVDTPEPPKLGSCRDRCVGKCQLFCMKRVCGFPLPAFLALLGGILMPTLDAQSDWAVAISWYHSGDYGWFKAALIIQLISGTLNGMGIAGVAYDWVLKRWSPKGELGTVCYAFMILLLIGLPLGIAGLAPVALAVILLWDDSEDENSEGSTLVMKAFKGMELVFEALPQSVLQVYVGVAYGKLDPSGGQLDYLLAVSVFISLLGAGATGAGFETMENDDVTLVSRTGIFLCLLRSAQTAALVFWVALMGCAAKGLAAIALAAAVVLLFLMGIEGFLRNGDEWNNDTPKEHCENCYRCDGDSDRVCQSCCCGCCGWWGRICCENKCRKYCCKVVHEADCDSDCAERCFESTVSLCGIGRDGSVMSGFAWGFIHLLVVGGIALTFFTAEHVDNNYLNDTLPMAGPGTPQHYDCHERTSGIYPATLATLVSVLLLFPAMLTDPDERRGWKPCQGKSWEQRNAKMEDKLGRQETCCPCTKGASRGLTDEELKGEIFQAKIKAIWRHANVMGGSYLEPREIMRLGDRTGHTYGEMCERFGVKPQRMDVSNPKGRSLSGTDGWIVGDLLSATSRTVVSVEFGDTENYQRFGLVPARLLGPPKLEGYKTIYNEGWALHHGGSEVRLGGGGGATEEKSLGSDWMLRGNTVTMAYDPQEHKLSFWAGGADAVGTREADSIVVGLPDGGMCAAVGLYENTATVETFEESPRDLTLARGKQKEFTAEMGAEDGVLQRAAYDSYMREHRDMVERDFEEGKFRLTPKSQVAALLCGC